MHSKVLFVYKLLLVIFLLKANLLVVYATLVKTQKDRYCSPLALNLWLFTKVKNQLKSLSSFINIAHKAVFFQHFSEFNKDSIRLNVTDNRSYILIGFKVLSKWCSAVVFYIASLSLLSFLANSDSLSVACIVIHLQKELPTIVSSSFCFCLFVSFWLCQKYLLLTQ